MTVAAISRENRLKVSRPRRFVPSARARPGATRELFQLSGGRRNSAAAAALARTVAMGRLSPGTNEALDGLLTIGQSSSGGRLRDARMKRSIWAMVSVATAAIAAAGPVAASCGPRGRDACSTVPKIVNFSAVPGISQQIVNQEPTGAKAVTQTLEAPPITTYTGPMVGVDKMVHAPTVGYYWSLEPDSSGH